MEAAEGGAEAASSRSWRPAEDAAMKPWSWRRLDPPEDPRQAPCQRSLHVAAVWGSHMYIIGGYDGNTRVNDFFQYDFRSRRWSLVPVVAGAAPSPRDRHTAVVYKDSFFVFGGFDGTSRVNDFHQYFFVKETWAPVVAIRGVAPSPRHSHATVVHNASMYCFGGYDGSYRNDFHAFQFETGSWSQVTSAGEPPRARYRASCVVLGSRMALFGGHDGSRHLNDVHLFEFTTSTWCALAVEGSAPPIPRDSHVAVVHGNSVYVFGGSTGSAMNDFHALHLDSATWKPVTQTGPVAQTPGPRFCHVAVVYGDSMFVFGGYDGSKRLNDFQEFAFGPDTFQDVAIPCSSLVGELRDLVDSDTFSDVTFVVEGAPVHAHKVLCMRCQYFAAMLLGEMKESKQTEIVIPDVRHSIFVALLEYIYTDSVDVPLEIAMELFEAADKFGVERLKKICESKMLASISVENAAGIFLAADQYHASSLREKCLAFVVNNFDAVSKTKCFDEMGRSNFNLVSEVLHLR